MSEQQKESLLRKAMLAGVEGLELADTKALLITRGNTHGSFETNAEVSQKLKRIFRMPGYDLSNVQLEALDMIALKLSRILSGKADFADHWHDIAGYAELVVKDLNNE